MCLLSICIFRKEDCFKLTVLQAKPPRWVSPSAWIWSHWNMIDSVTVGDVEGGIPWWDRKQGRFGGQACLKENQHVPSEANQDPLRATLILSKGQSARPYLLKVLPPHHHSGDQASSMWTFGEDTQTTTNPWHLRNPQGDASYSTEQISWISWISWRDSS
jgi:hypothetical protein